MDKRSITLNTPLKDKINSKYSEIDHTLRYHQTTCNRVSYNSKGILPKYSNTFKYFYTRGIKGFQNNL